MGATPWPTTLGLVVGATPVDPALERGGIWHGNSGLIQKKKNEQGDKQKDRHKELSHRLFSDRPGEGQKRSRDDEQG